MYNYAGVMFFNKSGDVTLLCYVQCNLEKNAQYQQRSNGTHDRVNLDSRGLVR